jgi:hypothetical protein
MRTAQLLPDAKGAIGKSTAEYLMERYGPLLSANDLAEVLRFSGTLALDRSIQRGHLSLKTFHMQGRRGVFAHANDVAAFTRNRWKRPIRRSTTNQIHSPARTPRAGLGKEREQQSKSSVQISGGPELQIAV